MAIALIDKNDPLAWVRAGDDDPIYSFDPGNLCGHRIRTHTNSWNEAECLRAPHPSDWLHISAADEVVEYVWLDVVSAPLVALTDHGLVCRFCACAWTINGMHREECPGPIEWLRGDVQSARRAEARLKNLTGEAVEHFVRTLEVKPELNGIATS